MKTKILSAAYFLIGLLFIIVDNSFQTFPAYFVKALIIPFLIVILRINWGKESSNLHKLMFAGLLFSWAGDVSLEFTETNANMFIVGLVFFLLAHVMYFTVFIITPGKNTIFNKRIYLFIPVILYGAGLLYYLNDDLGIMRVPVIVYALIILTMVAGAINRIEKVNSISFRLVLSGAILFVISDSSIAINKFSHHFEYSSVVIMSTYIIAQCLIVLGYIRQFRNNYS